ncbi:MAG: alanyl-tRNA editing protein [Thermoplasmata archaeon]|nr:alanyl-tRNA editing protein [Thermoplasmata archaeon]
MTELAYLADMPAAYRDRFTATVQALPPGAIVLDRTWFYPSGGGQPCDRGTLEVGGTSLPIVDVVKSGGSVLHRIGRGAGPRPLALRIGAEVQGQVDWARRHRHMRLHTAQHLVSAEVFTLTGLKTRKATLAGTEGLIELEAPWPTSTPWEELTGRVSQAVASPRAVQIAWVPRVEWDQAPAARAGLVPLPPNVDPVRVIEIDGHDRCPCGGTHVRSTGELGPVGLPPPKGATVVLTIEAAWPTILPE